MLERVCDRNGVLLLPLMYAFHKIKQAHIVLVSVSSLFLADLQAGMRVEFFLDIWNIFDAVTASQLRILSCEAGKLVSEASPSGYCLVDRYRVERLGEKGGLQGVL